MIILILILLFNSSTFTVKAISTKTYYAKILYNQVYLYKLPEDNNTSSNIYFEIPRSYFVELTDSVNDLFYKANYLNFAGYVKKESVQAVENTPTMPYLNNLNFRIYAELSRQLRSEPNISSSSSNLLATIPLYSRNLQYIGKIEGECLIDGRTNVWYFCKYSADIDYYGYVYSDFCDELPNAIPENTEEITFIANPTFYEEDEITNTNSIPLNSNVTSIIIGILTIPALIFIFMIIKSKSILTKEKLIDKEIKYY